VSFEVSIAILNHIADWHLTLINNLRALSPFEKPAELAAQVLAFLRATERDGTANSAALSNFPPTSDTNNLFPGWDQWIIQMIS
jgi:hypothetical protein